MTVTTSRDGQDVRPTLANVSKKTGSGSQSRCDRLDHYQSCSPKPQVVMVGHSPTQPFPVI